MGARNLRLCKTPASWGFVQCKHVHLHFDLFASDAKDMEATLIDGRT